MLNDNQITELSNKVRNLVNLVVLDLRNNKLSKLPEAIGACQALQRLYLGCVGLFCTHS